MRLTTFKAAGEGPIGMFYHLVLGCLRDGKPRHGYDVWNDLATRSGLRVNPGNVYRECAKLVSQGLIDPVEKHADDDPRRIPYVITDGGCRAFDEWFTAPYTQDTELAAWLTFVDRVSHDHLPGLLDRLQERLWLRLKMLTQAREDALARASVNGHRAVAEVAALQSLLEVKQATAMVEFVDELRRMLVRPPMAPEFGRKAKRQKREDRG